MLTLLDRCREVTPLTGTAEVQARVLVYVHYLAEPTPSSFVLTESGLRLLERFAEGTEP